MTDTADIRPEWFECWRDPSNFFLAARHKVASIPYSEAIPNYVSEAYVAGLFACVWTQHRECTVRLVSKQCRFPDAQLREGNIARDFEIVIADKKNRRMFEEHKKWSDILKTGQIPASESSTERQAQAREAIPRVCDQKVAHYLGSKNSDKQVKAELLIYLNAGAVLSVDEMVQLTQPYQNKFQSIWLLCGIDAVRTWPKRKVLRAAENPFEH